MARKEDNIKRSQEVRPEQSGEPTDGPLDLAMDGKSSGSEPENRVDHLSAESAHSFGFDLNGVPGNIQKVILNLLARVGELEAKTCHMPLARPMQAPDDRNIIVDEVKIV
jgi:hypothetical protein